MGNSRGSFGPAGRRLRLATMARFGILIKIVRQRGIIACKRAAQNFRSFIFSNLWHFRGRCILAGAKQAAEKQPFFRPVLVMRKLFAPGVLLWRGFRFSFCLCRPLLPARRDTSPPKLPGIESESACAFAPDCSPPAPADRTSPPGPTRVTSPGAAARSASTTRTSSQSACACSG